MKGYFKAIVLYGPPGAGKGTLANLLAQNYDLIHFDTGKYLENLLFYTDWSKFSKREQLEFKKEKELFEKGILLSPPFVLKVVKRRAERIAKAGWGVIFSGSPRTLFEAFGDKRTLGLIPVLERLYQKKNVLVFQLKVKPQTSINRNLNRLICPVCGQVPLGFYNKILDKCPICGKKMVKRSVDRSTEVIKVRLKEYQNRTKPILRELKKKGYSINKINGEPLPYLVYQQVLKFL